jgi:hypothetical protein
MKVLWISPIIALLSIAGCNFKDRGDNRADSRQNVQQPPAQADPDRDQDDQPAQESDSLVRSIKAIPPDNTAVNARDRKNDALTAADQSDKPEDIAVTQHIRQSIVADKNLSTDAKNVKIITIDGAVTLRGPVRDAFEKQLIEKAAIKVAGKHNVRDQLEGTGS